MAEVLNFEAVSDDNAPAGDGLVRLQALVDELDQLDANMEALDELLKSATSRYNEIRLKLLPSLFAELQTNEWTNAKGTKVKITDFVSGSLPKDDEKRAEALKHIVTIPGGDALIKTVISAEFPKSGHNEALALADDMRNAGHTVIVESGIHAQTLQGFAREAMKSGANIDLEKLGLFAGRTAKVTHKKVKPGSDKI